MSRETLLDEAIVKAKEAEDWQLVEWLRMARGGESAARWYTEKLREAEAENAKLRELVKDMVLNIGGCALHGNPLRLREFGSRAKELGIEVEG